MKFESCSAEAFGQVDLVPNKPGIPKEGLLSPRLKHRLVAGSAAALLAFAVGFDLQAMRSRRRRQPKSHL